MTIIYGINKNETCYAIAKVSKLNFQIQTWDFTECVGELYQVCEEDEIESMLMRRDEANGFEVDEFGYISNDKNSVDEFYEIQKQI